MFANAGQRWRSTHEHCRKIFLAPNLGINLDSLTINGRVFGGASNTNFQFVSGAKIIQPAIAAVPEPAVWGMMMAGFGLVGVASRRRRPNAVAA